MQHDVKHRTFEEEERDYQEGLRREEEERRREEEDRIEQGRRARAKEKDSQRRQWLTIHLTRNERESVITAEMLQEKNAVVILEDSTGPDYNSPTEDGVPLPSVYRSYKHGWMDRIFPHALLWFFIGGATFYPSGLINDLLESVFR